MKHEIKLHIQKLAVMRAIEILADIYPARILQKKPHATEAGAKSHIAALEATLFTVDGLCERKDMREDL